MTARDRILARIGGQDTERPDGRELEAAFARLKDTAGEPVQPPAPGDNALDWFTRNAEKSAARVHQLENASSLPAWLADRRRDLAETGPVCLCRTFADSPLNWSPLPLAEAAGPSGHWGLAKAGAAIAETGTVAVSSITCSARLLFLVEHLVLVVERKDLLWYLEDLPHHWPAMADTPRAIHLITGPSRTADVEQTIQLGAHGPRQVDCVILDHQ
jgi:hypothetical protein